MAEQNTPKTYALIASALNKNVIEDLEAEGADLLLFPPARPEKIELEKEARGLLGGLNRFDWLVFPDIFAVDYFFAALDNAEIDLFELDALRVCALGEAVADKLRFRQIHADVIPPKTDREPVVAALRDYNAGTLTDLSFLVPHEAQTKFSAAEDIAAAGAQVTMLPVYRITFEDPSAATRLKTLLRGGAADEFIFSSPADLVALRFFLGEDLPGLLSGIKLAARDEVTFQSLAENGLRPLYFQPK